ncbi:uncharacterized protein LOC62_05G007720 [Vanrija pseudolonga]|uniref:Uncharacterized protein n=1 Tax=Vanrija pseudolonga TaxID=143232 RepID=A0AAF0YFS4_9TREE|nr:hypothetical protein LOC62_05G007720 [Vanrija pseudolonga]
MKRFKSAFRKDGRDGASGQQGQQQPQGYPLSPPGQQQQHPPWPPQPPPQQQQQFYASPPPQAYPAQTYAPPPQQHKQAYPTVPPVAPGQHHQQPSPAAAHGHNIEESYTHTHSRATPPAPDPVQLALLHSPSPLQLSPETGATDAKPQQSIAQRQQVPAAAAQPDQQPQSQSQSEPAAATATSRASSATLESPSPAARARSTASPSTTLASASPAPAAPAPAPNPNSTRIERTSRSGAALRADRFGAAQLVAALEDMGTPDDAFDAAGVAVGARLVPWVSAHIADRDPRTQACALRALDVVSDADVLAAFKAGGMSLDTRLRLARALSAPTRTSVVDTLVALPVEEDPPVAATLLPYASRDVEARFLPALLERVGRWSALAKRHPGALQASLEGAMSREEKYALRPRRYRLALAALVKRAPRLVPFLWPRAVAPSTRPFLTALADVMPGAALLALKENDSLDPSRRLLRRLGRSGAPQVTDYAVHLAKRGETEVLSVFLRDMPPTLRCTVGTACKGRAVRWVDIVKTFSMRDAEPIAAAEMKSELSFEEEMEWVALLPPNDGNEILFSTMSWPETSARASAASALIQLNARMGVPQLLALTVAAMSRFGVTDPEVAYAVAKSLGTLPPRLIHHDMMPLLEPVVLSALEATDAPRQVLLDLVCGVIQAKADSKPHVDFFVRCFAAIVDKAGSELEIDFPVLVHRRGQERNIYSLFKPHVDAERARGSFSLLGSLPAALHPHTRAIPALHDDIGAFLFSELADTPHWRTLVPNLVYHYLLPPATQRARLEKVLARHPSVAGLDFVAVHLGKRYTDLLEPYISAPLPGSSVDKPEVFIPFPDGRCTAAWTAEQVDTLLRTYRRTLANPFASRRVWQSIFRVLSTIRGGNRIAEDYIASGDAEVSRWAYSALARCPSIKLGRWRDGFYGMFMLATQPPVYDKAKVTQGELDAWLGRYVQPFHLQCMFTASRFSLPSNMVEMLVKFFADTRWSVHERAGVAAFAIVAYRLPATQVRMELIHGPTIEAIAVTPHGAQERLYAIATRLLSKEKSSGWDLLGDALESPQSYPALRSLRPQGIILSYREHLASHLGTLAQHNLSDTACIECLAALVPYLTQDHQRAMLHVLRDLFSLELSTDPKTSARSPGPLAAGRALCRLARDDVSIYVLCEAVQRLVPKPDLPLDTQSRHFRERVTKSILPEFYSQRKDASAEFDEEHEGVRAVEAMRAVAEILGKHTAVFPEDAAHLYNYTLNVDAPADGIVAHIRKSPRLVKQGPRWLGVSRVLEGMERTAERQTEWLKVAQVLADDIDESLVLTALDIVEHLTADGCTPEWRALLAKLRRSRFGAVRKASTTGAARWDMAEVKRRKAEEAAAGPKQPSAQAAAMKAAADAASAKALADMGGVIVGEPAPRAPRAAATSQAVKGYTV